MSSYASEFELIVKKTIADYKERQKVEVITAKSRIDDTTGITVLFDHSGIWRSRPAIIAVVEAAVNAVWDGTYHDLFGAEACEAIPLSVFEEGKEHE